MNTFKKFSVFILSMFFVGFVVIWGLSSYIGNSTEAFIFEEIESIPSSETVIVLGASVFSDGKLSPILQDRVDTALELFNQNKVQQFLLSGDHRTDDYNEVDAMNNYLLQKNVPQNKIILDHAGYDTYDSMFRSKEVFNITNAIVVTQGFHLPRTIFIARNLDLDFIGYAAKPGTYKTTKQLMSREKLANFKALWEVVFKQQPTTLENPYNG